MDGLRMGGLERFYRRLVAGVIATWLACWAGCYREMNSPNWSRPTAGGAYSRPPRPLWHFLAQVLSPVPCRGHGRCRTTRRERLARAGSRSPARYGGF